MLIKSAKLENESETQKVVSWLAAIGSIIVSLLPLVLTGWIGSPPESIVEPLGLSKNLLTVYSGVAAVLGIASSMLIYAFRHSFTNPITIFGKFGERLGKRGKAVAAMLLLISFTAVFLVTGVGGAWKGLLYVLSVLSFVGSIEIIVLVVAIERDSTREQTLKWEALNQALLSNFLTVESIKANQDESHKIEEIHIRILKDKGLHVIKVLEPVANPHINYEVVPLKDADHGT